MCLVALALDQHRRFPLVIAANRDEFYLRPSTRLAWWTPLHEGPAILSGRDLESGGTWMGLTALGRLALLTNVREPGRNEVGAPSRGHIVAEWLAGREPVDRFWMRTALSGYNGFNLIAADFRLGECFWASNRGGLPRRLEGGVYGLSNAELDTPWPKVLSLKSRVRQALAQAASLDALAAELFEALADPDRPADAELPKTGVPLELERELAPAFIRTRDDRYGTRCSTLVITERIGRRLTTHVIERSFDPSSPAMLQRRTFLRDWPPNAREAAPDAAGDQGTVFESEVEPAAWPRASARPQTSPVI
jgi:uncharacterized protein with NRDE domain